MIDVQQVLEGMPHLERFCSVDRLVQVAERLARDPRFEVRLAGASVNGTPIYHVSSGKGTVKALFVAFPHCMEPIGGLTVLSLLSLLEKGDVSLLESDVEWHVIPCIDPDGARLNEGWTQRPFSFETYMKHFHLQALDKQVDTSFPISYKKLVWDKPSVEAEILRTVIDEVRPDFYFSLHNAWTGGAFYYLSRDIGARYYEQIYELLRRLRFPIQRRPIWRQFCREYSEGFLERFTIRKYYDYLEATMPAPERLLSGFGAHSKDYLEAIKPDSVNFTAELGYVRHPKDESERLTGQNLRHFKLRVEADSKYLGSVLLEEWTKVKDEVDATSPFFESVAGSMAIPLTGDALHEGGLPLSFFSSRNVLLEPGYDCEMTEADLFNACVVDGGYLFLFRGYQFIRLLKASAQTARISRAIERLEPLFDSALMEIGQLVDFTHSSAIDYDTLAKVQLGSGLIVLNSVIEARGRPVGRR